MWQITGVNAEFIVEGTRDGERFAGRVIAVAVEDGDVHDSPAAAPTWFLVADDRRARPVWVRDADVTGQRLGR